MDKETADDCNQMAADDAAYYDALGRDWLADMEAAFGPYVDLYEAPEFPF